MESLLLNPISLWLRWVFKKIVFQLKNDHLRLDYLSDVKNCRFGKYNVVYKHSLLMNTEMGDFSYISKNSQVYNTRIGKFTCIGPSVKTGLGLHPSSDFVSSHPVFYSTLRQSQVAFVEKDLFEEFPVTEIGNDVWIGANAVVRDGVKIGDGAIIGAGAVVTKDIPPYAIVGGVPAKLIRYRFSPEEIGFLQQFKWWDKDIDWLRANKDLFLNIKELMRIHAGNG
jgi:acetyltransferase-like isoleucine patch superfamily enzyme